VIVIEDLHITVGAFALRGAALTAERGRYAVLMGRSGAGKTTLLEAVCGLKAIERGRIEIDGRDVTALPPARRGIGFVPQEGALFTTMTVRQHLEFGPTVHRWLRAKIDERVDELAALLEITELLDRRAAGLSGGERQRVALGRALAARPSVLCLDEPLSALDDESRGRMHALLRAVRDRGEVTTLHITHNLDDARRLADCVFRLDDGVIRAVDMSEIAAAPPTLRPTLSPTTT